MKAEVAGKPRTHFGSTAKQGDATAAVSLIMVSKPQSVLRPKSTQR